MNPLFVGATIRLAAVAGVLVQAGPGLAQGLDPTGLPDLDQRTAGLQSKMLDWRRDIHQNPELSGRRSAPQSWLPIICVSLAWRSRRV